MHNWGSKFKIAGHSTGQVQGDVSVSKMVSKDSNKESKRGNKGKMVLKDTPKV